MNIQSKVELRLENILEDVNVKDKDINLKDYLDSIKLVTLIVDLEETFGIVISDEDFDVDKYSSVDSIVNIVNKYL